MVKTFVFLRAKPETVDEAITAIASLKVEGLQVIGVTKIRATILGFNLMVELKRERDRFDFNGFGAWFTRLPEISEFCHRQTEVFEVMSTA